MSTPLDLPPPSPHAAKARWIHATESGDRLVAGQRWKKALQCYQQALRLAVGLFTCLPDPDDAVATLVTSYRKLADLLERLGRHDTAHRLRHDIHLCVLEAASDTRLGSALRAAAARQIGPTLDALTRNAPLSPPPAIRRAH